MAKKNRRTSKRNTKAALTFLALKPKLEQAFDRWAAATPDAALAAETEYRAMCQQARVALSR